MADKELFRVRAEFNKRVSKSIIEQLLDKLLEDFVLNDGEKDSIREENSSTANKARDLIDRVMKKGAAASTRMIVHLETLDPSLYTELGLSLGPSAQSAAAPLVAQSGSTTTVCTMEEFWKMKQDDPNVYRVTKDSYRSRVALLITNIEFKNLKKRTGAVKDEENMENLLTIMGYEVVKHRDLTGKAIEEAFKNFIKHSKLKETDSVVVVIMSHGKLGAILGVNWKDNDDNPDEFHVNDIFKLLGPEECPSLLNKPKIVVIQACRGDMKGAVLCSDAPNKADEAPHPCAQADYEGDKVCLAHREKDFITFLSCTPDTVSYRHPDKGSLLIQFIVEVFKDHSLREPINELFRKVMHRFENLPLDNSLQMPTIDRCTMTKTFYLFPDLVGTNH